ncbi:glycosyltransferase family 39 protein [Candidatus Woesearchaeota archaeon]|nr:glycosyltransferase family 39 protein [Candidatus Woesearchaeota archaeon]
MEKATRYWLTAIFILTLVTRLVLAFVIPNFTYESYFNLRQVEHIHDTGLPLYQDELSYNGRESRFLPFFHYLLAGFSFLMPLELVAKIIPNIFISLITILVYLISKKITNNDPASLISAFIAGFMPVLYFTNSFTVETLFLPLTLFAIYCFLNIPERKYLALYLVSFIVLSLTSTSTVLILIGFGIYTLLSYLEQKQIRNEEKELMLFSLFLFVWLQLLFFKKVLINEGIEFIWQNIPPQIIQSYFPEVSILQAVVLVSVVPFLAGLFVVYQSLFKVKSQRLFLLISLVIATTSLAWFSLLRFNFSLSFFGAILAILFASFYYDLAEYVSKTKFPWLRRYLLAITLSVLILTIVPLALSTAWKQDTPTNQEIAAFQWLEKNTPPGARVASTLPEGHLVTYYSKRPNFMDDQFSLIKNVKQRFMDLNTLYTTKFQTQALNILEENKVQYLVLTPSAKEKYGIEKMEYLTQPCFQKIYDLGTRIYSIKCNLEETMSI